MATELAKAYVQIIPSAQGISGGIANVMNSEASSAGTSSGNLFAGAFKKIIASAGIGLAVKKVFGDAFSNGGELQQNLGGTEVVFGKFANKIQTTAQSAYKNMGMSASDYMSTANKMGSLFQGSGIEQKKALDMTSEAMQRAADVASVMGIDTSMAMESIAGAAKGNFTMMDNLGVSMNATTLEAYALEKGMNFEWKTASNAEKAELAMKMFMDRTSQYAGNFAKESEQTWSGSIGAMKASYQDLMANIMLGNDLGPSLTAMGETIKNFVVNNLIPALVNIVKGIPVALISVITGVGPQLVIAAGQMIMQLGQGIVQSIPLITESANSMMNSFILFVQTKLPELLNKGVEFVTNIVNGILQNLPQLITTGGNMITRFIGEGIIPMLPKVLKAGVDLIINIVNGIINSLPKIVSAVVKVVAEFIKTIGQNLPKFLEQGIKIIGKLASGLIKAIPNLVSKVPQICRSVINAFKSVDWLSVGVNIIKGIANGLKNAGSQLWSAVKGVLGNFKDKVLSFFGIHSPSRWGEYVGKMIALGPPRGVERNLNPFRNSMEKFAKVASDPLENVLVQRNNPVSASGNSSNIESKLERLIQLLQLILNKDVKESEIKMYLKDREVARALKEMGVVFA